MLGHLPAQPSQDRAVGCRLSAVGLSALALKRQIGLNFRTAWVMRHKFLHAIARRVQARRHEALVQSDDACHGCLRSDGSTGGGAMGRVR
jgi:hypothetical protein